MTKVITTQQYTEGTMVLVNEKSAYWIEQGFILRDGKFIKGDKYLLYTTNGNTKRLIDSNKEYDTVKEALFEVYQIELGEDI
jgi:hypothetical protein